MCWNTFSQHFGIMAQNSFKRSLKNVIAIISRNAQLRSQIKYKAKAFGGAFSE
jgi:hypothetical protein